MSITAAIKFQTREKDADMMAGVAIAAVLVVRVATVVVKLLREDKISTSWQKTGEENERKKRGRGATTPRRSKERRGN